MNLLLFALGTAITKPSTYVIVLSFVEVRPEQRRRHEAWTKSSPVIECKRMNAAIGHTMCVVVSQRARVTQGRARD